MATLHLADLFQDPKMTLPTMGDYDKIRRYLSGSWPAPIPARTIVTPKDSIGIGDIDAMSRTPERDGPYDHVVIDTEYGREDHVLSTIGVGLRRGNWFGGFQVMDWPRLAPWQRDLITGWLRTIIDWSRVCVFQNTMADIPVLEQAGIFDHDYIHVLLKKVEDTMLAHAVLWSEWPHSLEFLASVYGQLEKLKHLSESDPALYNWGDVCDTDTAYLSLKKELDAEPSSEAIYRTQSLPLLPVLLKARRRGIRIHRPQVERAAKDLAAAIEQAEYLATAHAGWPLELGSVGEKGKLAWYLYEDSGLPIQYKRGARNRAAKKITVDADAIASLRAGIEPVPDFEQEERDGLSIEQAIDRALLGADPVLEARVVYADALQSLSHYIEPAVAALARDGRFYPQFLIHAQANARWSTNGPPLAQLPDPLRTIIYPDEHCVWLGHDWDQIELRINAEVSNDLPSLEAFKNGWDIHVLNMCDCFGYPYPVQRKKPWAAPENADWIAHLNFQGKDDARRVFAKRFVYRLDYGGDPANAGDIPGAQALGFIGKAGAAKLIQASQRYLAAHPAKAAYRMELARIAHDRSLATSLFGRRRRLTGDRTKKIRDAFDFPMQASVSDWFNLTVLAFTDLMPWLEWMYGMHDSHWWQCPEDRVEDSWPQYRAIVERKLMINGRETFFPATFKQCCTVHKDCLSDPQVERIAA